MVYNLDEDFINKILLFGCFSKECNLFITNFYFVRAPQTKLLSGMLPVGINPTGRILHKPAFLEIGLIDSGLTIQTAGGHYTIRMLYVSEVLSHFIY